MNYRVKTAVAGCGHTVELEPGCEFYHWAECHTCDPLGKKGTVKEIPLPTFVNDQLPHGKNGIMVGLGAK